MKLFVPKDYFSGNPIPPRAFLCTTGDKRIGELQISDLQGDFKWNAYSEISFVVNRNYTDFLTGETIVNPLFDKIETPRTIYLENMGFFIIQDVNTTYGDKDEAQVSCFSKEYSASQKYLNTFVVNKGTEESKEVIYAANYYPSDTPIEQMYKLASKNLYDADEKYFHRVYSDSRNYTYEQIQIDDENDYLTHFGESVHTEDILYIHGWAPVTFYDPHTPELSLLHLIFNELPMWKIGHVDYDLRHEIRSFEENRVAIYDFIMSTVCDTFQCVCEWDTIKMEVNFYKEEEDGLNEDGTVATKWDTDVFISRSNLASQINISYSADNIKTKLKVSGSDDLDIREVNLGRDYIMNLSYYHNDDWMEQDLYEAYSRYLDTTKEASTGFKSDGTKSDKFPISYPDAMQKWVEANKRWNEFVNAVPADGNVVLVGDPFEKLYCTYTPINTAYSPNVITETTSTLDKLYEEYDKSQGQYSKEIDRENLSDGEQFVVQGYAFAYDLTNDNFKYIRDVAADNLNNEDGLIDKLTLYHINEDINCNVVDNYLLRLRNKDSDLASIRIYNANGTGTDDERKAKPDYQIHVVITYAQSGITSAAQTYSMNDWIRGKLTASEMGLTDYTVQYIGVMGAYFVLAKDEREEAVLEEYGVNLLKSKHETYITIFQTQTEAMFSQEKYQCIAQKTQPEGSFDVGTRWLDIDSTPIVLKEYNGTEWKQISGIVSKDEQKNYENYQQYIDNYEKLQAVQNVLVKKEKQATYMRDGYEIADRRINIDLYTRGYDDNNDGVIDEQDSLRYNGQTLEGDMHRAAMSHFGDTVTPHSMDQNTPIYYFTTSVVPDGTIFAVYLHGITPYVAYATSQGVCQTIMNWITKMTDLEKFFTEDQWNRLSPFIREDEFSDSNFLLTSYESEKERLEIYEELKEAANKELNKLCQPSLEFSMDMANILAIPEFKSLINQFQLGNFIRVHVRDGYVKKARLLTVHLNYSDLSDFSCDFGNLVTAKSEIDKHADLLSQAVTAGKQVAASAGDWQKAVDKSKKLEQDIANGLTDATLEIGKSNGQSIEFGQHGLRGRKLIDGTTDQYEDEQVALINNKLVFTADGWKTSKAAFGKFVVDGVEHWGVLSDAVVSGYIEGSTIKGGHLEIGGKEGDKGKFVVHEDGSVEILAADAKTPVYATRNDVDLINQATQYRIELLYDESTVFGQLGQTCTLICKVYKWGEDVTSKIIQQGVKFSWFRNGEIYATTDVPTFTVTNDDIDRNSVFSCSITFDDTQIQ